MESNEKKEFSDEQESLLSHSCKFGKASSSLAGGEHDPAQPSLLTISF